MLYLKQVLAIVRKDARVELRTRDATTAMIVFAIMAIVMLNFALRLRVDSLRPLTPGVLWVMLVFAGTLGLSRSMSAEHTNQCIDGLLMAPCDRSVIFFGKALANALFTLVIALIVTPLMAILFDESLLQWGVLLIVALGVVGYAGAGTLIATMAASTRAREVFLPILLFPLALPLVVASVVATSGFLDRLPFAQFGAWLGVVVTFLIIFWTAGTLLYEYLLEA
ncbi:MAG: heme exporter protein CcmB [Anaerolineae bacterium]|nr:heme exporter protein CcmB [Thermoflexales bacterium]MDW8406778.1 heme exporter protein CcmB [Anaerolineae bacterium]